MKLALRELRRQPSRFATASVILTLIALLLMFLGGLLDGLTAGNTGALRAQQGQLVVYSATSQDSLVRSRIDPPVAKRVEGVPGVRSAGGLGSVQLGARLDGRGPRDLVPVVLLGYALAPAGLPAEPPEAGTVIADASLQGEGVRRGTVLKLGPERTEVRVTGFVDDTRYSGQGTLWASLETWREVLSENRPATRVGEGVTQALVLQTAADADLEALASNVDEATDGATSTLTIDGAIEALPGLASQERVFNQIISVTVLIAIVVVALFFALITLERSSLYGVLKAIGAGSRTLFAGVVAQAVIVTLLACVIAAIAALALDAVIPVGGIPFIATGQRILSSTIFLLIASIVGCAFSLRRVLRIDPATAIGG